GFLNRHRHWLAARLPRQSQARTLGTDIILPLRGVDHEVIASGLLRGRVEAGADDDGHFINVPGDEAHQPRRLYDWLKAQALTDLTERSEFHAARLGVTVKQVRLRS